MPHPVFSDTLIAGTTSKRGNKYAQVYTTSFGWSRAYPMTQKSKAHETLSLMFHRDGVPPTMILDNSKEQTLGDFKRKLREADCHLRQTEPYTPWQQAAEGCIRELKRGVSRKMIKTGDKMCPYVLRPKRYAHVPEFDGAKVVIPDAEYFWDR